MTPKKTTKSPAVFSSDELSAMRERSNELRTEAKAKKVRAEGVRMVLAAIAKMPEPDRSMAKRVHRLITAAAPTLWPKTWYGMPAYATRDGAVVCFFQNASKFKYRYSTLGFQDAAHLDHGNVWPVAFALKKLTPADEKTITALVTTALGKS